MGDFFEGMTSLEQTFWIVAVIGSAVFLVVFAMTLLGGDVDADVDADISDFEADDGGAGFQFFTFKNFVAFFTIFGWTGVICQDYGLSTTPTILISTAAGLVMMFLTSLIFFWMFKLSHSGTLKIQNAVGAVGEVYLPVGANRSSIGKIQVKVQGALRELEAITDHPEDLKTTTIVKVTAVISAELLLVEKLS
ncbi:MAG: hypothetical protein EP338_08190 [Bacteroidetes bacterium]|nr:MAG: hypothetical protein EP338_08190 [Bacteroidota bacterium]